MLSKSKNYANEFIAYLICARFELFKTYFQFFFQCHRLIKILKLAAFCKKNLYNFTPDPCIISAHDYKTHVIQQKSLIIFSTIKTYFDFLFCISYLLRCSRLTVFQMILNSIKDEAEIMTENGID